MCLEVLTNILLNSCCQIQVKDDSEVKDYWVERVQS